MCWSSWPTPSCWAKKAGFRAAAAWLVANGIEGRAKLLFGLGTLPAELFPKAGSTDDAPPGHRLIQVNRSKNPGAGFHRQAMCVLFERVFPQALAWAAWWSCAAQWRGAGCGPGGRSALRRQIEMDVVHALDASKALKSD